MTRAPIVLVVLGACGSAQKSTPSPTTTPPPACDGTLLDARAPDPLGWVDELVWLDATTLVAFVGGGPNLDANGVLVLDVAGHKIVRGFRGLGPVGAAAARAGSHTEILFEDQIHGGSGWEHRVGTLDLATGCVRASSDIGSSMVAIDPVHAAFVVGADSTPDTGHRAVVRYDAATLQPGAKRSVPRFDALAYDRASDLVVMTSYGDDPIRTRDPLTLDEHAAKALDVQARSGFSLRPGRAQIAMPYTKCTPTGVATAMPNMRIACKEGHQETGWILVGVDPMREIGRATPPDRDCDSRRMSWTVDGARAFTPCHGTNQLLEWTPDTGAFHMLPAPALDYWSHAAWAPDGDTFAASGATGATGATGAVPTIDVRSMSAATVLWQIPLR